MEREIIYLLADLCVKWGFCLSQDDFEAISKSAHYHALDFALDVVSAEGLDESSSWVERIAGRFRERFGCEEIDAESFVDRVRGVMEDWN